MPDPPMIWGIGRAGRASNLLAGPSSFFSEGGISMAESKKRLGRPRVDSLPVTVRLTPPMLAWLDQLRSLTNPPVSRPEMIRSLLERIKGN
jgi:hypothetical protein